MLAINRFYQPSLQVVEPPPTALAVAAEYVQKPAGIQNLVLRPAIRALKWADFMGGLTELGKECKAILGNFSLALFWLDFPEDLRKVAKSVSQLREKIFAGSFWEVTVCSKNVFVRSAFASDLVAESVLIANSKNIVALTASQVAVLSTFGFMGSTALTVSALSGLKTQFDVHIHSEIGSPKFKLSLIKMSAKACLVAIGVFGMVASVAGSIIPTIVALIVSTLYLILSLASYFYEKLYVEKEVESKA
ncbi:MAG: hypothetical protein P0S96_03405 [Simkaniaceae bacterium]|nr:hypothetical protein [Candidatus Sacchlamyda saccharinae]